MYKKSNEANSYEEAVNAKYFYAGYDVWKHEKKVDYTWRSGESVVYPPKAVGSSLGFASVTFGRSKKKSGLENLHPVVKASYVLELIRKQTNVFFSFAGSAKEYIDTLVIPLISKKSNELTFDGHLKADLRASVIPGALSLSVTCLLYTSPSPRDS